MFISDNSNTVTTTSVLVSAKFDQFLNHLTSSLFSGGNTLVIDSLSRSSAEDRLGKNSFDFTGLKKMKMITSFLIFKNHVLSTKRFRC
jgi:hypothetical protein